jgi:hypothetical protein
MLSQLFFASSCACVLANVPGFSILKKEREVARMKSCKTPSVSLICQSMRWGQCAQPATLTAWKRL